MTRILVRRAQVVVTMDDDGAEHSDCDILIEDGWIREVAQGLAAEGADVLDAAGFDWVLVETVGV